MKGYVNISAERVIKATLNRKAEFERLEAAFDKFKSEREAELCWSWFLLIPYKTNTYKKHCVVPFGYNYKEVKKLWPESLSMLIKYSSFNYEVYGKRIRNAAKEDANNTVVCDLKLAEFVSEWADFKND